MDRGVMKSDSAFSSILALLVDVCVSFLVDCGCCCCDGFSCDFSSISSAKCGANSSFEMPFSLSLRISSPLVFILFSRDNTVLSSERVSVVEEEVWDKRRVVRDE